ncbi:hypothetical protein ACOTEY_25780 [Achromobacter xylosoxidans]
MSVVINTSGAPIVTPALAPEESEPSARRRKISPLTAEAVLAAPGREIADAGGLPAPKAGKALAKEVGQLLDSLVEQYPDAAAADLDQVMRLFYMIQQSSKEARRENARAAAKVGFDAGMSAAANIRSAADERLASARMSAGASIAGGALQVGGGVAGGAFGIKAARENKLAADAQGKLEKVSSDKTSEAYIKQKADFDDLTEKSSTLASTSQAFITSAPGSAQAVSGAGQMAAADREHEASDIDAQKMKWEAVRAAFESAADAARDDMKGKDDIMRDLRDKLSAIQLSKIETNSRIARNI